MRRAAHIPDDAFSRLGGVIENTRQASSRIAKAVRESPIATAIGDSLCQANQRTVNVPMRTMSLAAVVVLCPAVLPLPAITHT